MMFQFPKPAKFKIVTLLTLLTACAQQPNYAPVKTVNQALEPTNGYYLRKKLSNKKNNNPDASRQSTQFISKEQHSHKNQKNRDIDGKEVAKLGQDKPYQTYSPVQSLKKEGLKTKTDNLAVIPIDKNQPSKSLKSTSSKQQPIGYTKNNSIISNTNKATLQNNQHIGQTLANSYQKTEKNKKSIISIDNKKVLKLNFQWPLLGRISRNFSQTDSKGILIKGKNGQAVHAAEAGKAVYCGQGLAGFGNLAIIKHNETYLSAYANNSKLFIKEGEQVEKGQTIGQVGLTGLRSSSLHFEIRKNGKPINPLIVLPKL
jgi:lipoprotein NlpD